MRLMASLDTRTLQADTPAELFAGLLSPPVQHLFAVKP